jgi:hypothetical protein
MLLAEGDEHTQFMHGHKLMMPLVAILDLSMVYR